MKNQQIEKHISAERMLDYMAGALNDEQEEMIEVHIAHCNECTAQARRLERVDHFMEQWTARDHGQVLTQLRLANALNELSEKIENLDMKERLKIWLSKWTNKAEAALSIIVEETGRASRIITEGLEAMVRPDGMWEFELKPAAVPVRGAGTQRGAPITAVSLSPGKPQVRVRLSAENEIAIRVDAFPEDRTPPLVLLIPAKKDAEAMVNALQRQQDKTCLSARFHDVPPGAYIVAFEPIE